MTTPEVDRRSLARRALDEQIAAEPPLAPPDLPPDAIPSPVEAHLGRSRRAPWRSPVSSRTAWCVPSMRPSGCRNTRGSSSWRPRRFDRSHGPASTRTACDRPPLHPGEHALSAGPIAGASQRHRRSIRRPHMPPSCDRKGDPGSPGFVTAPLRTRARYGDLGGPESGASARAARPVRVDSIGRGDRTAAGRSGSPGVDRSALPGSGSAARHPGQQRIDLGPERAAGLLLILGELARCGRVAETGEVSVGLPVLECPGDG